MNGDPITDPVPLPWLAQAVELEALATMAQIERWNDEDMLRAQQLLAEITSLMAVHVEPPIEPPVEPPVIEPPIEPPVEPPVYPEPIPPEPPLVDDTGKLIRAKHPPPATKDLTAKPSTLLNVVRNAEPGAHIWLESGDYGAGYRFDKAFPPDKKLVIRSKVPLEANFTVPPRFMAPGYWLYECRASYDRGNDQDSFGIKVEANHVNVTRCWLQGKDGIASRLGAIGYCQFNWNRFTGRNKYQSAASHIYIWLPDAGAYTKPTDGPNNMVLAYNYFNDPVGIADEDHSIYFGHTKAGAKDMPMMEGVYVDYNFFAETSKRKRPLYMKRGCYVRRNTCLSTERNFGIRHGMASKVWANVIKSTFFHFSGAMVVGGTTDNHHDIRGNEAAGSLMLFCGSEGANQYQAASYALVASNKVKSIEVGVRSGNVSAAQGGLTKGCRILLDGKLARTGINYLSCQKDTITVDDGDGGLYIPQTDRLDETRVGLETAGQASER